MNCDHPVYIIQERSDDWPYWEDEQEYLVLSEAIESLSRLRKGWIASEWRIVEESRRVLEI